MHEVLLFNRIFNPCSLTKGHWYAIQNKWTKINWDKKLTTTNIKDLSGNSGNRFKKIYTQINVQWKMFDLIYLVCSVPVRLFLWAVAISAISTNNRQQGQTLMIWAAHWTKPKIPGQNLPMAQIPPQNTMPKVKLSFYLPSEAIASLRAKPSGSLFPRLNGPMLVDICVQTHHDATTIEPCHVAKQWLTGY